MMTFSPTEAPRLVVFVDAEEEFRWHTYSSAAVSVRNIAAQFNAQQILSEFGVRPTYLVDYPVAAQPEGYQPLKAMLEDGLCTIGAQLHPWVNPPIEEEITPRNTYAGNLPAILERAKIERLTSTIARNFGTRPVIFKAGRYGAGPNTAAALMANGYCVDASVMPFADFSADGGPDYSDAPTGPYWLDNDRRLLEIPTTVGLVGLLSGARRRTAQTLLSSASASLRVPGALSRLSILERIRLTPEGFSLEEAKRLTLAMLQQGQRLFVLSYHSSSLLPGGAPYVTSQADLDKFLMWLDGYMRFFFGPLSGQAATALETYDAARAAPDAAADIDARTVPIAAVA
ncbi:MAG: polysaccharide deacetylase family protein [Rhodospirillaceae bacterium]